MKSVIVIGAGVIGLTTAVYLQRQGYRVSIWAEKNSPDTLSDAAGAVWYPSFGQPAPLLREWARQSYEEFRRIAKNPQSGVRWVIGKKIYHRPMGHPWFHLYIDDYRRLSVGEIPADAPLRFRIFRTDR